MGTTSEDTCGSEVFNPAGFGLKPKPANEVSFQLTTYFNQRPSENSLTQYHWWDPETSREDVAGKSVMRSKDPGIRKKTRMTFEPRRLVMHRNFCGDKKELAPCGYEQ